MTTSFLKKTAIIPFFLLVLIAVVGAFLPVDAVTEATMEGVVASDVAWMLCSTALVLLMTPGLSYFYGGMVGKKNVISTMTQSFVAMCVISVLWVVVGFSLAFGESLGGFIGNPLSFPFFSGVLSHRPWPLAPTIPMMLFALFQLKFAIITPALITGAFAERVRFVSYLIFICLFFIITYAPLAHWTWHPDGILFQLGVLDFAGGVVVHISAGCAALISAIYLKRRQSYEKGVMEEPANIPYVILGTGLLWFGWFGFNAGSSFSAGILSVTAFGATNMASASAGLAWVFLDGVRGKKPSALGLCIGAVVGLVAVTPAAGFVSVSASVCIGVFASVVSNFAVRFRSSKTTVDDTLDVFPCHGVGGLVGMLMTSVFASSAINSGVVEQGLIFGETSLFFKHLFAMVLVVGYSCATAYLALKVTDMICPLRVDEKEESVGLDISQHGEKIV